MLVHTRLWFLTYTLTMVVALWDLGKGRIIHEFSFFKTQFKLPVGCLSGKALDGYVFQKEIMEVIEEIE